MHFQALPVYLGADIDMKVEPISNAVMYGKVKVTFHLDMRGTGSSDPVIGVDTMPVFEIHTSSEIADDDASDFNSQVTDNMGPFGWTNFGGSRGNACYHIVRSSIVLRPWDRASWLRWNSHEG